MCQHGKSDRGRSRPGPPGSGGRGLHPVGRGICEGGGGLVPPAVSRPVSDLLDEADPIEGSYTFEVSSAGADRALKKPEHFEKFRGEEVEVKLYRPREGRKEFVGRLQNYQDGAVTLEINGDETVFTKQEIALVRLYLRV